MKIDFPKKYKVELSVESSGAIGGHVYVPVESIAEVNQKLLEQDWIQYSNILSRFMNVRISGAYEVTLEEAHDAICKLIEYVMQPEEEIDTEVWDFSDK